MIGYAEQNGLMHSLLFCASYALEQIAFPFTKKVFKACPLGSLPAGMKKELLPPPNQVMEAVLSVFTHSNSFVHQCRRPI